MKKFISKWRDRWIHNKINNKMISNSLENEYHQEQVDLALADLNIHLYRQSTIDTPNEITVVIPRVEIRQKCLNENCSQFEKEIIFNSVTVVSAPRHPLAGPSTNNELPIKAKKIEINKNQK